MDHSVRLPIDSQSLRGCLNALLDILKALVNSSKETNNRKIMNNNNDQKTPDKNSSRTQNSKPSGFQRIIAVKRNSDGSISKMFGFQKINPPNSSSYQGKRLKSGSNSPPGRSCDTPSQSRKCEQRPTSADRNECNSAERNQNTSTPRNFVGNNMARSGTRGSFCEIEEDQNIPNSRNFQATKASDVLRRTSLSESMCDCESPVSDNDCDELNYYQETPRRPDRPWAARGKNLMNYLEEECTSQPSYMPQTRISPCPSMSERKTSYRGQNEPTEECTSQPSYKPQTPFNSCPYTSRQCNISNYECDNNQETPRRPGRPWAARGKNLMNYLEEECTSQPSYMPQTPFNWCPNTSRQSDISNYECDNDQKSSKRRGPLSRQRKIFDLVDEGYTIQTPSPSMSPQPATYENHNYRETSIHGECGQEEMLDNEEPPWNTYNPMNTLETPIRGGYRSPPAIANTPGNYKCNYSGQEEVLDNDEPPWNRYDLMNNSDIEICVPQIPNYNFNESCPELNQRICDISPMSDVYQDLEFTAQNTPCEIGQRENSSCPSPLSAWQRCQFGNRRTPRPCSQPNLEHSPHSPPCQPCNRSMESPCNRSMQSPCNRPMESPCNRSVEPPCNQSMEDDSQGDKSKMSEQAANDVLDEMIETTIKGFNQIAKTLKRSPNMKCIVEKISEDEDKRKKLLEESIAQTESSLSMLRKSMQETLLEMSRIIAKRTPLQVPAIANLVKDIEEKKCPRCPSQQSSAANSKKTEKCEKDEDTSSPPKADPKEEPPAKDSSTEKEQNSQKENKS